MTPLDEFKKLLPSGHNLSEDEIITMRDLIDMQTDSILNAFIAEKVAAESNKGD